MKIMWSFLFMSMTLSLCDAFVEVNSQEVTKSVIETDNPFLIKLLQSVDEAPNKEYLVDVTLKLLKSVCVCMRETLRAKQKNVAFNGEMNSLYFDDTSHENDAKVLELYKTIYNKTCFNVQKDLAKHNFTYNEHVNCGKDDHFLESNKDGHFLESTIVNDTIEKGYENKIELKPTLFKLLVLSGHLHNFTVKKQSLFKNRQASISSRPNYDIIFLITLNSENNRSIESNTNDELDRIFYSNSLIDITILTSKPGEENITDNLNVNKNVTECNLLSLYLFFMDNEKNNLNMKFRILNKKGTLRVYIETTSSNDYDYLNRCCNHKTRIPECDKNRLVERAKSDNKSVETLQHYKNTITKIKHLVKLYKNRVAEKDNLNDEMSIINSVIAKHNSDTTKNKSYVKIGKYKSKKITEKNIKQKMHEVLSSTTEYLETMKIDMRRISHAMNRKSMNRKVTNIHSSSEKNILKNYSDKARIDDTSTNMMSSKKNFITLSPENNYEKTNVLILPPFKFNNLLPTRSTTTHNDMSQSSTAYYKTASNLKIPFPFFTNKIESKSKSIISEIAQDLQKTKSTITYFTTFNKSYTSNKTDVPLTSTQSLQLSTTLALPSNKSDVLKQTFFFENYVNDSISNDILYKGIKTETKSQFMDKTKKIFKTTEKREIATTINVFGENTQNIDFDKINVTEKSTDNSERRLNTSEINDGKYTILYKKAVTGTYFSENEVKKTALIAEKGRQDDNLHRGDVNSEINMTTNMIYELFQKTNDSNEMSKTKNYSDRQSTKNKESGMSTIMSDNDNNDNKEKTSVTAMFLSKQNNKILAEKNTNHTQTTHMSRQETEKESKSRHKFVEKNKQKYDSNKNTILLEKTKKNQMTTTAFNKKKKNENSIIVVTTDKSTHTRGNDNVDTENTKEVLKGYSYEYNKSKGTFNSIEKNKQIINYTRDGSIAITNPIKESNILTNTIMYSNEIENKISIKSVPQMFPEDIYPKKHFASQNHKETNENKMTTDLLEKRRQRSYLIKEKAMENDNIFSTNSIEQSLDEKGSKITATEKFIQESNSNTETLLRNSEDGNTNIFTTTTVAKSTQYLNFNEVGAMVNAANNKKTNMLNNTIKKTLIDEESEITNDNVKKFIQDINSNNVLSFGKNIDKNENKMTTKRDTKDWKINTLEQVYARIKSSANEKSNVLTNEKDNEIVIDSIEKTVREINSDEKIKLENTNDKIKKETVKFKTSKTKSIFSKGESTVITNLNKESNVLFKTNQKVSNKKVDTQIHFKKEDTTVEKTNYKENKSLLNMPKKSFNETANKLTTNSLDKFIQDINLNKQIKLDKNANETKTVLVKNEQTSDTTKEIYTNKENKLLTNSSNILSNEKGKKNGSHNVQNIIQEDNRTVKDIFEKSHIFKVSAYPLNVTNKQILTEHIKTSTKQGNLLKVTTTSSTSDKEPSTNRPLKSMHKENLKTEVSMLNTMNNSRLKQKTSLMGGKKFLRTSKNDNKSNIDNKIEQKITMNKDAADIKTAVYYENKAPTNSIETITHARNTNNIKRTNTLYGIESKVTTDILEKHTHPPERTEKVEAKDDYKIKFATEVNKKKKIYENKQNMPTTKLQQNNETNKQELINSLRYKEKIFVTNSNKITETLDTSTMHSTNNDADNKTAGYYTLKTATSPVLIKAITEMYTNKEHNQNEVVLPTKTDPMTTNSYAKTATKTLHGSKAKLIKYTPNLKPNLILKEPTVRSLMLTTNSDSQYMDINKNTIPIKDSVQSTSKKNLLYADTKLNKGFHVTRDVHLKKYETERTFALSKYKDITIPMNYQSRRYSSENADESYKVIDLQNTLEKNNEPNYYTYTKKVSHVPSNKMTTPIHKYRESLQGAYSESKNIKETTTELQITAPNKPLDNEHSESIKSNTLPKYEKYLNKFHDSHAFSLSSEVNSRGSEPEEITSGRKPFLEKDWSQELIERKQNTTYLKLQLTSRPNTKLSTDFKSSLNQGSSNLIGNTKPFDYSEMTKIMFNNYTLKKIPDVYFFTPPTITEFKRPTTLDTGTQNKTRNKESILYTYTTIIPTDKIYTSHENINKLEIVDDVTEMPMTNENNKNIPFPFTISMPISNNLIPKTNFKVLFTKRARNKNENTTTTNNFNANKEYESKDNKTQVGINSTNKSKINNETELNKITRFMKGLDKKIKKGKMVEYGHEYLIQINPSTVFKKSSSNETNTLESDSVAITQNSLPVMPTAYELDFANKNKKLMISGELKYISPKTISGILPTSKTFLSTTLFLDNEKNDIINMPDTTNIMKITTEPNYFTETANKLLDTKNYAKHSMEKFSSKTQSMSLLVTLTDIYNTKMDKITDFKGKDHRLIHKAGAKNNDNEEKTDNILNLINVLKKKKLNKIKLPKKYQLTTKVYEKYKPFHKNKTSKVTEFYKIITGGKSTSANRTLFENSFIIDEDALGTTNLITNKKLETNNMFITKKYPENFTASNTTSTYERNADTSINVISEKYSVSPVTTKKNNTVIQFYVQKSINDTEISTSNILKIIVPEHPKSHDVFPEPLYNDKSTVIFKNGAIQTQPSSVKSGTILINRHFTTELSQINRKPSLENTSDYFLTSKGILSNLIDHSNHSSLELLPITAPNINDQTSALQSKNKNEKLRDNYFEDKRVETTNDSVIERYSSLKTEKIYYDADSNVLNANPIEPYTGYLFDRVNDFDTETQKSTMKSNPKLRTKNDLLFSVIHFLRNSTITDTNTNQTPNTTIDHDIFHTRDKAYRPGIDVSIESGAVQNTEKALNISTITNADTNNFLIRQEFDAVKIKSKNEEITTTTIKMTERKTESQHMSPIDESLNMYITEVPFTINQLNVFQDFSSSIKNKTHSFKGNTLVNITMTIKPQSKVLENSKSVIYSFTNMITKPFQNKLYSEAVKNSSEQMTKNQDLFFETTTSASTKELNTSVLSTIDKKSYTHTTQDKKNYKKYENRAEKTKNNNSLNYKILSKTNYNQIETTEHTDFVANRTESLRLDGDVEKRTRKTKIRKITATARETITERKTKSQHNMLPVNESLKIYLSQVPYTSNQSKLLHDFSSSIINKTHSFKENNSVNIVGMALKPQSKVSEDNKNVIFSLTNMNTNPFQNRIKGEALKNSSNGNKKEYRYLLLETTTSASNTELHTSILTSIDKKSYKPTTHDERKFETSTEITENQNNLNSTIHSQTNYKQIETTEYTDFIVNKTESLNDFDFEKLTRETKIRRRLYKKDTENPVYNTSSNDTRNIATTILTNSAIKDQQEIEFVTILIDNVVPITLQNTTGNSTHNDEEKFTLKSPLNNTKAVKLSHKITLDSNTGNDHTAFELTTTFDQNKTLKNSKASKSRIPHDIKYLSDAHVAKYSDTANASSLLYTSTTTRTNYQTLLNLQTSGTEITKKVEPGNKRSYPDIQFKESLHNNNKIKTNTGNIYEYTNIINRPLTISKILINQDLRKYAENLTVESQNQRQQKKSQLEYDNIRNSTPTYLNNSKVNRILRNDNKSNQVILKPVSENPRKTILLTKNITNNLFSGNIITNIHKNANLTVSKELGQTPLYKNIKSDHPTNHDDVNSQNKYSPEISQTDYYEIAEKLSTTIPLTVKYENTRKTLLSQNYYPIFEIYPNTVFNITQSMNRLSIFTDTTRKFTKPNIIVKDNFSYQTKSNNMGDTPTSTKNILADQILMPIDIISYNPLEKHIKNISEGKDEINNKFLLQRSRGIEEIEQNTGEAILDTPEIINTTTKTTNRTFNILSNDLTKPNSKISVIDNKENVKERKNQTTNTHEMIPSVQNSYPIFELYPKGSNITQEMNRLSIITDTTRTFIEPNNNVKDYFPYQTKSFDMSKTPTSTKNILADQILLPIDIISYIPLKKHIKIPKKIKDEYDNNLVLQRSRGIEEIEQNTGETILDIPEIINTTPKTTNQTFNILPNDLTNTNSKIAVINNKQNVKERKNQTTNTHEMIPSVQNFYPIFEQYPNKGSNITQGMNGLSIITDITRTLTEPNNHVKDNFPYQTKSNDMPETPTSTKNILADQLPIDIISFIPLEKHIKNINKVKDEFNNNFVLQRSRGTEKTDQNNGERVSNVPVSINTTPKATTLYFNIFSDYLTKTNSKLGVVNNKQNVKDIKNQTTVSFDELPSLTNGSTITYLPSTIAKEKYLTSRYVQLSNKLHSKETSTSLTYVPNEQFTFEIANSITEYENLRSQSEDVNILQDLEEENIPDISETSEHFFDSKNKEFIKLNSKLLNQSKKLSQTTFPSNTSKKVKSEDSTTNLQYTESDSTTFDKNLLTTPTHYNTIGEPQHDSKIYHIDVTKTEPTKTTNLKLVEDVKMEMKDSKITDWWLDDMYLKVRLPLPINSNPGMVLPRRHFAKMEEVADLGALFIDDLLDYKEMLDRGELPQERATSREKGQPLCMEQFYRLLGVARSPRVDKDVLELPSNQEGEREELVVVACRNYFYPIPVKATDRGRLTAGEIQAQILHAMVDAAGAPPAPRVGLLTSMNRDSWAKAREQLMKDENNRTNLELITRALCLLCVDEAGGDRADTDSDTNAMLRAMHGAGTAHHSANRWFDKTVQLIISSDGTLGMCYEHSSAEGVAVIRLMERALARAEVSDRPAPPPVLLPAPQAMKWNITPDVQRTIDLAARDLDRAIADLDFKVYTYRGYGREFMKSCRTSPDVYIQLALQYAYFKMYGYLTSTYESASLRRFRSGRVDNIRSAHAQAKAWAEAMCTAETQTDPDDGQKKDQKKLELFDEAAQKQTDIMEDNILGRGIDNHLLGLREAARESLGHLPQLFTDPVYKMMIEYKLSTSQVSTTTEGTFMGYGPVVPDGYGCSYNPKKESIIFCISSLHSSSVTNTEAFRQFLEEALDSMKLMLQNRKVD